MTVVTLFVPGAHAYEQFRVETKNSIGEDCVYRVLGTAPLSTNESRSMTITMNPEYKPAVSYVHQASARAAKQFCALHSFAILRCHPSSYIFYVC